MSVLLARLYSFLGLDASERVDRKLEELAQEIRRAERVFHDDKGKGNG